MKIQVRKEVSQLTFDLRRISELATNTPGCLRSDLGELNFPVAKEFTEAIKVLADKADFSYAATFGHPTLLKALDVFEAESLKAFDQPKTLVTSGGQAALFAIINSIIKEGDHILTDMIYYPPYKGIAQLTGAELVVHDFTQLEDLDPLNVKIVIINSPQNPSGKIYDKESLSNLAQLAREHNWLIIEDAVYNRIYFEKPPLSIATVCPERTLVINSASKNFCLPGARIGWIIGEAELVTQIAKMHRNMNSCPNTFFQKVLGDFLGKSESYLVSLRKEMKIRRDALLSIFDKLGWAYDIPKGSIYVFVTIPNLTDSFTYVEELIQNRKVSAMPGLLFGNHPSSLRFCFGALTMEDIEELGRRLA